MRKKISLETAREKLQKLIASHAETLDDHKPDLNNLPEDYSRVFECLKALGGEAITKDVISQVYETYPETGSKTVNILYKLDYFGLISCRDPTKEEMKNQNASAKIWKTI